jgi:glucokinase
MGRSRAPAAGSQVGYAVGVDRGASNVRLGLVRDDGNILKVVKEWDPLHTVDDLGPAVHRLLPLLQHFLALPEVQAVPLDGIGVVISGSTNRQGEVIGHVGPRGVPWQVVPAKAILEQGVGLHLPVHVDNDSKGAAWGEYLYGAGRGTRNMICLTVGTGIGGGVVVDGKLVHGARGLAGHAALVSVDMHGECCPSGVMGCVEHYASGSGIARAARSALRTGRESALLVDAKGDIEAVTSEMVFATARSGDVLAREIVFNAAYALGIAISSLLHVLNPEVVVVGGGVADQGELFLDPVRRTVIDHSIPNFLVPIKAAKLGNLAGVVGAAALCWQRH